MTLLQLMMVQATEDMSKMLTACSKVTMESLR